MTVTDRPGRGHHGGGRGKGKGRGKGRGKGKGHGGKRKPRTGADARHLVRRFSYGLTPGLLKDVDKAGGADAWFARQVTPATVGDAKADAIAGWWPSLARTPLDLWQRNNAGTEYGWEVMADDQRWLLLRRVHTDRQGLEVRTEFWENHLNVPVSGDGVLNQ